MQIPDEIDRRIDSLGRNDPDEAESIIQALVYAIGYCPAATAHYLILLQDDQEAFRTRISGLQIRSDSTEVE